MTRHMKLTDRTVEALQPERARYTISDAATPGLELRVEPSGRKTWCLVYRLGPKVSRLTLGRWGVKGETKDAPLGEPGPKRLNVTCKLARAFTAVIRTKVDAGIDPTCPDPRTTTVAQAVERYLIDAPHSRDYMDRDVVPVIGARPISTVTRADVRSCLDHLLERAAPRKQSRNKGEAAANRLRSKLGAFLRWAYEHGLIDKNPARDIRPYKEAPRTRVLRPGEIVTMWRNLDSCDCTPATIGAVRFALVTGQRIGEVCGMTRQELRGSVWFIPGSRTKNGRDHEVPLSDLAREIIGAMPGAKSGSPFIFPGRNGAQMQVNTPGALLRRYIPIWKIEPPFTPHDLRRSCATGLSDLGVAYHVISDTLNHARRGVTAVYVTASSLELKRAALQLWADYLRKLLKEASENNPAE